jgi:hypothetical protein
VVDGGEDGTATDALLRFWRLGGFGDRVVVVPLADAVEEKEEEEEEVVVASVVVVAALVLRRAGGVRAALGTN